MIRGSVQGRSHGLDRQVENGNCFLAGTIKQFQVYTVSASAARKTPEEKTVARYWQPVTTVQYINMWMCCQLVCLSISVRRGRQKVVVYSVVWCLCKNTLKLVVTHTHIL